jgi:hypothetical protein
VALTTAVQGILLGNNTTTVTRFWHNTAGHPVNPQTDYVVSGRLLLEEAQGNLSGNNPLDWSGDSVFTPVTSGDGWYADGSFIFHYNIPYTGSYGQELMENIAILVKLLGGSTWEIDDPDRRIALVAHAGTNSVTICHLLGLPPTPWEWDRFVIGHASISRVMTMQMGDGHTFGLRKLSDVEHLAHDDRTERAAGPRSVADRVRKQRGRRDAALLVPAVGWRTGECARGGDRRRRDLQCLA